MTQTTVPKHILMAGCGGTGSYLAPLLANLYFANEFSYYLSTKTSFFDPDNFEHKNRSRQNFAYFHQGTNKAASLSSMYKAVLDSRPFGIALNEFNLDHWYAHFRQNTTFNKRNHWLWFIVCSDNNAARCDALLWLMKKTLEGEIQNWLWVTPGNDDTQGQVYTQMCKDGVLINDDPLTAHPTLRNGMNNRLRDTNTYGCGVNAGSGTQSMMANNLAATSTALILQKWVEEGIYVPEIHFNAVDANITLAKSMTLDEITDKVTEHIQAEIKAKAEAEKAAETPETPGTPETPESTESTVQELNDIPVPESEEPNDLPVLVEEDLRPQDFDFQGLEGLIEAEDN